MPERGLRRFKSTRRLFTFASGGEDLRVRRSTDPPSHCRRRTVFIFHIILIDVSPPFGFYPFRGSFQSEARDRHLIGRCNFFCFISALRRNMHVTHLLLLYLYALLQCAGNVHWRRYLYTFLLSALCCFTLNRRLQLLNCIAVIAFDLTFSPRTRYSR